MANELLVREDTTESGFVTAEVFLSPLPGIEPIRVKARIGSLVKDILPAEARVPMVCLIDGVPMKREWWMQRPVCEGDMIQFAPVYLGGKGGSRSILAAIAAIAIAWFAPQFVSTWGSAFATAPLAAGGTLTWLGHLAVAGIVMVGNALISAVVNPGGNQGIEPDKASSIYSVDTQGNAAKVFSPIPVQYGRMKYYPNYASQPYVEYHTREPDIEQTIPHSESGFILKAASANEQDYSAGVQYYYALFCLGQGEYEIEQKLIGDANTYSFGDVLCAEILPPGTKPRYVHPCVVMSEAVSGNTLDKGDWIGPFPCCGPTRKTNHIALDFIFPQGLCKLNDKGKAESAAVNISVQLQPINNAGETAGGQMSFGPYEFKASSLTPQRRTIHITTPDKGRYQVRVQRIGAKDPEDTKDMTSVQWAAMKAYLDEPAPLCETATHFELVMRASEQLSSLTQRKISIIATRKVPTWDSDTPVPSRSPAHALWDKWTNSVYGDGLPRDRIDIDMLRHYHEVAEQRGDKFDYVFENRSSSQEADQLIAKTMRCVALQRQGVKTIVRDELCDMPLTMFNPTNTVEKSVSLDYIQITEETTDGVIVEYFSSVSWDWEEVECPGPNRTYSNPGHTNYNPALPVMTNPARITLDGVTTRAHAEREGLYYAYTNALRRQFVSWTTELQGALVYYGAPVLLATTLYNMQQGGEVRDYNSENGTIELTNAVSDGKIVFMRFDGSLTEPMDFTVVDESRNAIRLNGSVDAVINYGDYKSERTKYVILNGEMIRRIVKIMSVSPKGIGQNGAPLYELRGVVDVPEVHTADEVVASDNPDIPPWEDPDVPPDTPVVPTANYTIVLKDIARIPFLQTYQALYPNTGYPASLQLYRDGALRTHYYDRREAVNPVTRGAIPGQEKTWNHWVEGAPIADVGSLYEVMFVTHFDRVHMLGQTTVPDKEFLDGPRRWLMDGHKLNYSGEITNASLANFDASTASVLSSANKYKTWNYDEDVRGQTFVYTDWISLDTDPELKGFWDTKPYPYPTTVSLGGTYMAFYVAIRDKATHTVQNFHRYMMGIYRQDTP